VDIEGSPGELSALEHVRDNLRTRGMEEAFGKAAELAARLRDGAGQGSGE